MQDKPFLFYDRLEIIGHCQNEQNKKRRKVQIELEDQCLVLIRKPIGLQNHISIESITFPIAFTYIEIMLIE